MATFSFDIVSEYDKAEVNNAFQQSQKIISGRYDFKGTLAAIDWIDDKTGIKIVGDSEWQVESVLDIVRKELAKRGQSSKILDESKPSISANLKVTKLVPFIHGMNQEKSKSITKIIRDNFPKAKPVIQGEAVRVSSSSKDELQAVMRHLESSDLDFVIRFENYR